MSYYFLVSGPKFTVLLSPNAGGIVHSFSKFFGVMAPRIFTARCTLVQSAFFRLHVDCLSVSLSVTLVDCDHIGWNSSGIISRLVSLRCSLSADPNNRGVLQEEHPEILAENDPPPVDLSVGDIRSQIAVEWLQIAQRSQRDYRKLPSLFR